MATFSGLFSKEQNLANLLRLYATRNDGAASNYTPITSGYESEGGYVPGSGSMPEGGYNWQGMLDQYNPRRSTDLMDMSNPARYTAFNLGDALGTEGERSFDAQYLSQFDSVVNNPGYTADSFAGPAPINGTDREKIDWMNLVNIGGSLEAMRQDTVAQNKRTDLTEGALMAAAMAGVGGLALSGAGLGAGGVAAGEAAGAGAFSGGMGIPELGMIANPATANAALGAGIPSAMLSGGPGALTLAGLGAGPGSGGMGWEDWLKRLMGNPFGGGGGTGGLNMPWNPLSSLSNLITGAQGRGDAKDLMEAARAGVGVQNPFMTARPGQVEKFLALQNDPSSIENVPGYKSGLRARERALAAQGFNPGVNRQTGQPIVPGQWSNDLANYGGNFYGQEMDRLMTTSGAKFPPSGGNLFLQGATGSTNLRGQANQSMAAGGYGLLSSLLPMLLGGGGPSGGASPAANFLPQMGNQTFWTDTSGGDLGSAFPNLSDEMFGGMFGFGLGGP